MTQVTNFKKGTVALAVLLVLVVAKTTNAIDFKTSDVNGIKMKSAAGCDWALKTGVWDEMIWSYGPENEPQSDVDCRETCAKEPTCTHWGFGVPSDVNKTWVSCGWLTDTTFAYDPVNVENRYHPTKSFCGYFPSRAPSQTDTVDDRFPKFVESLWFNPATKFAAGCKWSEDGTTAASYKNLPYIISNETTFFAPKSLGHCVDNCSKEKENCTHYLYLVPKGTERLESSQCFSVNVASPPKDSYQTIRVPSDIDPDQSACGFMTKLAPNQKIERS